MDNEEIMNEEVEPQTEDDDLYGWDDDEVAEEPSEQTSEQEDESEDIESEEEESNQDLKSKEENQESETETKEEPTPDDEAKVDEEDLENASVDALLDTPVIFLHEEKKLKDFDQAQIKEFMQKGQNYDRLSLKLDAFEDMAELLDVSLDDLTSVLFDQTFDIVAKKNGSTKEAEQRVYKATSDSRRAKRQEAVNAQLESERKAIEKKRESEIKAFSKQNPGVKWKDLPKSVQDDVNSGVDINLAYMKHQMNELKSENQKLSQQIKNSKTSPVKVSKGLSTVEKEDPDFAGWDDDE